MERVVLSVSFPSEDLLTARDHAIELTGYLLNGEVVANAEVVKDRNDTADLGSIVQIVLTAPLVTALATPLCAAIADWLRHRRGGDNKPHDSPEPAPVGLTVAIRRTVDGREDSVAASGNPDDVKDVLERFLTAGAST